MMRQSAYEWNDQLKQFKPIGWTAQPKTQMGDTKMSDTQANQSEVQVYDLKRKSGRVDKIRFTGKRGKILDMMKAGKSNDEIVAEGFSKNTVLVVRWQATTLNILASAPAAEPTTEA